KCAFLRTVIRELDLNACVHAVRVEDLPPLNADVISARALADLTALLSFSQRHMSSDGTLLFLKGKNWRVEVEEAQTKWNFAYQVAKSRTSEDSTILSISGVSRV
ncbi:MAG: RsmG family class I SAM-dependent methyltransferase, partial [Pseudomonadota bacterium]